MIYTLAVIFFLILSFNVHADYTQACFESSTMASSALKDIDFLKVPGDSFKIKGECVRIETSSMRINLYQKYLKKSYPVSFVDIIPDNAATRRDCHLSFKKVFQASTNQDQIELNNSNSNLSTKNSNESNTSISQMVLTEGLEGEIRYDEDDYIITCFQRGDGFEIRLRNLSPNMGIITSRTLKSGQEIELGEFIQQNAKQNTTVSVQQGLQGQKTKESKSYKLFLSVK